MALRAILGCSTYRDDSALDFAAPRRFPARNAIPKPGQKTIPDHIRIPRQRYSLATVSVTATVLTFDAVIQSLPKGYTYRKVSVRATTWLTDAGWLRRGLMVFRGPDSWGEVGKAMNRGVG
jgi:hypothetical protein